MKWWGWVLWAIGFAILVTFVVIANIWWISHTWNH